MPLFARLTTLLLLFFAGAVAHAQTSVSPQSVAPTIEAAGAKVDAGVNAATIPGYRFGVADKVRIIVYNEPSVSGEFTVNSSGDLSLPLIGDVRVQNKTTTQVISEITTKLADGYLRDPKVSIDVLTYRPYYILGEVTKPGEYPYSSNLTVMNAVATAEGFTYRANKGSVFIKRAGETKETKLKMSADLTVSPGDTIRVGERYF